MRPSRRRRRGSARTATRSPRRLRFNRRLQRCQRLCGGCGQWAGRTLEGRSAQRSVDLAALRTTHTHTLRDSLSRRGCCYCHCCFYCFPPHRNSLRWRTLRVPYDIRAPPAEPFAVVNDRVVLQFAASSFTVILTAHATDQLHMQYSHCNPVDSSEATIVRFWFS